MEQAESIKKQIDNLDSALNKLGPVVISPDEAKIIKQNLEINISLGKDPYYYLTEIDPNDSDSDDSEDTEDDISSVFSQLSTIDIESTDLLQKLKVLQFKYQDIHVDQLRPRDYKAPFPRPQLPAGRNSRLDILCLFLGPTDDTKVMDIIDDPNWNAFKKKMIDIVLNCKNFLPFGSLVSIR